MKDLLKKLREANKIRQIEWTGGRNVSLSYRGNELAGETGEACNVVKKLEREILGWPGSRTTKEELGKELADVVICADLIAMDMGIDLGDAIVQKFNYTSEKVGLQTKLDPSSGIDTQFLAEEFCRWPLPTSVCADHCATVHGREGRSGTNLLSVSEMKQFFDHLVEKGLI